MANTISDDWNAMCTLFLKNAAQFNLSLESAGKDDELEIFGTVFGNGFVQTLVKQWIVDLPDLPMPSEAPTDETVAGPQYKETAIEVSRTKEVNSESEAGRYVVVADGRVIQKNELIISEPAFALVPIPSTNPKDRPKCSHCADWRTLDSLRCADCSRVSFCGSQCQEASRAEGNVHRFECAGHRLGIFEALGVSHLAVRTLLLGCHQLAGIVADSADGTSVSEWWPDLLRDADSKASTVAYARVLRLMTNFKKTAVDDLMRYALTAVMLTLYLKERTDFFESESAAFECLVPTTATSNEAELLVGALILEHIGQIINNAHTISGLVVQPPPSDNELEHQHTGNNVPLGRLHTHVRLDVIATALYPHIAMLNHSCVPNIRNYFEGNRLTIYALRELAAGDEVLNCYCSVGSSSTTIAETDETGAERRQMLLDQYGFECQCAKCTAQPTDAISSETYLCPCGGRVNVAAGSAVSLWWRHSDRPADVSLMKCPKCNETVDFGWYDRFMMMFEREAIVSGTAQQRKWLAADTCRMYADEVAERLAVGHRMRYDMASMVAKLFPLHGLDLCTSDGELIELLMPVLVDYANGPRQQFGDHSLEYIESSSMWLDLQVLRKHLVGTPVDNKAVEELRQIMNRVLDNRVQCQYGHYFDMFVDSM